MCLFQTELKTTDMKCEELEEKIIDYLDNKLDKEENLEIEKHLETCERCLDEFRDLQQVMKLISGKEEVEPDDSLRINFYHMLHSEIKKSKGSRTAEISSPWYNRTIFRIAAGFAILICGTLTGIMIQSGISNSHQAQLEQLKNEVITLKKTAMFTMLKEESSSYRLQALNYADELDAPDQNVIEVLVKTLNTDKNVNVRMAAAYALAKYANQQQVRDSLVKSLSLQSDPILQITLINILVERREKSAAKPIQKILTDENTLEEVKHIAENGIKMLI
jgi:hypothetical protein